MSGPIGQLWWFLSPLDDPCCGGFAIQEVPLESESWYYRLFQLKTWPDGFASKQVNIVNPHSLDSYHFLYSIAIQWGVTHDPISADDPWPIPIWREPEKRTGETHTLVPADRARVRQLQAWLILLEVTQGTCNSDGLWWAKTASYECITTSCCTYRYH